VDLNVSISKAGMAINIRKRTFQADKYRMSKPTNTTCLLGSLQPYKQVVFLMTYMEFHLYAILRENPKNPVDCIDNPKPEQKMVEILTLDEIKQVFKQLDSSTFHGCRNYIITKLLLDRGMRIGEFLSLFPEYFDFHT